MPTGPIDDNSQRTQVLLVPFTVGWSMTDSFYPLAAPNES